ncbi:hypothetical protein CEP54_015283 [Fusarium duplospermum]|uniref:Uncharacterized protein n=1 Tax=Fusarium duplospermum TaxID=1325734 RepID=A0A428NQE6_9HYPO|nr:hypothetical protein CEP54_015283 [Fusarium duplospermum]
MRDCTSWKLNSKSSIHSSRVHSSISLLINLTLPSTFSSPDCVPSTRLVLELFTLCSKTDCVSQAMSDQNPSSTTPSTTSDKDGGEEQATSQAGSKEIGDESQKFASASDATTVIIYSPEQFGEKKTK